MTAETLLSWYYLIFWLPMLAAAFLMLISSLRLGHHHALRHGAAAHAGGHARVAVHSGTGAAHRAGAPGHHAPAVAGHHTAGQAQSGGEKLRDMDPGIVSQSLAHSHRPRATWLDLIGASRAPLPIVLESFFLFWGFVGFWADRVFIHPAHASALQIAASIALALAAGALGARGAAEVVARVLPPDESAVLSREGLFGLTGKITFPVDESAGRIFIYDEYGTLHDESCRVAPGQPPIARDSNAIVLDVDKSGHLIVKEIA